MPNKHNQKRFGAYKLKTANANPTITTETIGSIANLHIGGRVLHGANSARAVLAAIEDSCRSASEVVIHIKEVTKIDAAGIGALAAGCAAARNAGVRYRVEGASGLTLELVELTGLRHALLAEAITA